MVSPDPLWAGSHDYRLVALSVLISVLGAYVARDLAARVAAGAASQLPWLMGGATASAVVAGVSIVPVMVLIALGALMAVGRIVSVALQNARAYRKIAKTEEDLRQLSGRLLQLQDEERRQIARELHDTTAQDLAALTIDLTLISRSIPASDSKMRNRVIDALALAQKCLRDIRTLSYLLHPPLLDEGGLIAALKGLADGFGKRSGIQLNLDLPPELGRLTREAETALFRIVQECLNNIHRHSRSSTARIRLARAPTAITLEVKDEGVGIPPGILGGSNGGSASLGVGIRGMRERMRQLGGKLEIISDGRGTAVRATLPLP